MLDGPPSFPHGDTIWNCYDPCAQAWIPTTLVNLQLCRRRGDRCQPMDIEEVEDWVRELWNQSERRKEHEQGQVKAAALSRLASVRCDRPVLAVARSVSRRVQAPERCPSASMAALSARRAWLLDARNVRCDTPRLVASWAA